ncbi:MAG: endonuclease V [Acidobacteria bacterium]|nr:endonuclease V [Acidobacteriota bacterium]
MILLTDVYYRDQGGLAAGIVLNSWDSNDFTNRYSAWCSPVADYEPGSFFKRELPCLLQLIAQVPMSFDLIVVDGHVWLHEGKPGLGAHLHQALGAAYPIIGIAKSAFARTDQTVAVCRGTSQRPLYVSSIGIPVETAMSGLLEMVGAHRKPDALTAVDHWSRSDLALQIARDTGKMRDV